MKKKLFIVIDDDDINNFMCELLFKTSFPEIKLKTFNRPVEAFNTLSSAPIEPDTTILLDLNMPIMNAFDFLEACKKQSLNFSVFILTSSINPIDEDSIKKYAIVKGFYSKPLTIDKIKEIISK